MKATDLYERKFDGLHCRGCGRIIRDHPFGRTAHGRMHVRKGEATEHTDWQTSSPTAVFLLAPSKEKP